MIIITLVIASFAFVSALAWNEAIKSLFETIFPDKGNLGLKFLYAISHLFRAFSHSARLHTIPIYPSSFKPVTAVAVRKRIARAAVDRIRVLDLAEPGIGALPELPGKYRGNVGQFELFVDAEPMHIARWPSTGSESSSNAGSGCGRATPARCSGC